MSVETLAARVKMILSTGKIKKNIVTGKIEDYHYNFEISKEFYDELQELIKNIEGGQ